MSCCRHLNNNIHPNQHGPSLDVWPRKLCVGVQSRSPDTACLPGGHCRRLHRTHVRVRYIMRTFISIMHCRKASQAALARRLMPCPMPYHCEKHQPCRARPCLQTCKHLNSCDFIMLICSVTRPKREKPLYFCPLTRVSYLMSRSEEFGWCNKITIEMASMTTDSAKHHN